MEKLRRLLCVQSRSLRLVRFAVVMMHLGLVMRGETVRGATGFRSLNLKLDGDGHLAVEAIDIDGKRVEYRDQTMNEALAAINRVTELTASVEKEHEAGERFNLALETDRSVSELARMARDESDLPTQRLYYEALASAVKASARLDHGFRADRSKIDLESLQAMVALSEGIVAIGKLDPVGNFIFRGTGFVFQRYLLTCAHNFSLEFVRGEAGDKFGIQYIGTQPREEATRVHPIVVSRSDLSPERDFAMIELKGKVGDKADAVHKSISQFYTLGNSTDTQRGAVFGFGTREVGRLLKLFWLPPGRIAFPPTITKRERPADPNLGYAFRSELTGLLSSRTRFFPSNESEDKWFDAAFSRIWDPPEGRSGYTRCDARTCRLVYPADPNSRLAELSEEPEFQSQPRIECFGVDLPGEGGLSGAPVFKLVDGRHRLIGFYAGLSENPLGVTYSSPTLDSFKKVLPFDRLFEEIIKRKLNL